MKSAFVLACLLIAACASPPPPRVLLGESEHVFEGEVRRDVRYPYLLYVPPAYAESSQAFPLLIFLHGSGETGDNLDLVRRHGPPRLVHEGRSFPFLIVSPQAPVVGPWDIDALDLLLAEIKARFRIDERRIYLTGLSNGAKGAWAWASARPDVFAALAPIAGYGDPSRACALRDTPVWAFHGADDDVVPELFHEATIAALERCGGRVAYTVYEGVGHDSWTRTYAQQSLYDWLLSHRR